MNPNKFLTLLMGQCWHEWEWKPKDGDIHIYECKCGLRVGGRPQKPDHLSNSLPVIRWMEKEMPGVLDNYLHWCFQRPRTSSLSDDIFFILDLRNLVTYLVQNPSWGEKECEDNMAAYPDCVRENCDCHGSGLIVHPALRYAREEG